MPDDGSKPRKPRAAHSGPAMTLANMRANGVRSLVIYCHCCHHSAELNADAYPDDLPVPWFGPRLVCTRCGMVGADARPDWSTVTPPGIRGQ